MKTCSKCGMSKSTSAFRASARSADGLAAWCIECHKAASRAHHLRNKEARNAAAKQWATENRDKALLASREYHARNKDKRNAEAAEWARENRDARRQTDAKRKAAKRQATPSWADLAAIKAVYSRAVELQRLTGLRMHVDHIVPIQSPLVCGLHCEGNLQVMPGAENEAKKNYWWPDMPEQAYAQRPLFEPAPTPKPQQLGLEAA